MKRIEGLIVTGALSSGVLSGLYVAAVSAGLLSFPFLPGLSVGLTGFELAEPAAECQEDCLSAPVAAASTAAAVQLCLWPGSEGTGGCEARPPIELRPGEQVQLYAAVLLADGTVECTPAGLSAGCDSASSLLDFSLVQDTTPRSVRFRWPRQAAADEYNIVVTDASTFLAALDTILADTFLVWGAGAIDSIYFVKGAGRFQGLQASFGDSVQFGFPTSIILAPVAPIVVDTIP